MIRSSAMARAFLDWSVERKMILLLLAGIVVSPLATFVLLQSKGQAEATNYLIVLIVASLILFVPFAKWVSHILALRSIRELNEQCRLLKEGKWDHSPLPPDGAAGHDFLTLKRNMHWMGHTLASRERKLQAAMKQLAMAHRQIGESLDYARLIQTSFLPDRTDLFNYLSDHFLFWEQRDAVGGDAYWLKPAGDGFFLGVLDCTGHGVPGAFMTLIVTSLLDRAAEGTVSPAEVLGRMNRLIKEALGQSGAGAQSDDGMDCSLCHIPSNGDGLVFAGANSPLYVLDGAQARCIRGDRCGLGYVRSDPGFRFTDVAVKLPPGSRVYLASDGLPDQVGGDRRFPYGKRRFMEFIEQGRGTPIAVQGADLSRELKRYQGEESRRDDVTVIGFELRGAVSYENEFIQILRGNAE